MLKIAHVRWVALGALALGSLTGFGCAVEDGTGAVEDGTVEELIALEEPAEDQLAPDEGGAEPTSAADTEEAWTKGVDAPEGNLNPGRYCVDQSYASIQYVNIDSCGGLPCQCPNQLTPHAQFSRNHPVNVHLYGCGPYYFVKDLWSSNYGWMRQDALRPC
jgi:hypothetical protein